MAKGKGQKNKQGSTVNTTQNTKDGATRTPPKPGGGELICDKQTLIIKNTKNISQC